MTEPSARESIAEKPPAARKPWTAPRLHKIDANEARGRHNLQIKGGPRNDGVRLS